MRSLLAAIVLMAAQPWARTEIGPPSGGTFYGLTPQFAVSPDARHVVFVASAGSGPARLWVQAIGEPVARPLSGTEQASYPFWSADSRFVGFFASGRLQKVPASGGAPIVICGAPNGRGATWNREDVIVFTSGISDPLRKVSAAGGEPAVASVLDTTRENSHRFPQFLPDGRHVLYWAGAGSGPPVLKIGSLDSTDTVIVAEADTNGVYAAGRVFYGRNNALVAQPIDEATYQKKGDVVRIDAPLSGDAGSSFASLSVARDGTALYTRGTARPFVLTWFDRSGRILGRVGDPGLYTNVALSADDKKIAVSLTTGTPPNRDIWVLDAATGAASRVTDHPAVDASPIWSADGRKILFSSQRDGPYQVYVQDLATGALSRLFPERMSRIATDWALDGLAIAYTQGQDVHLERLGGSAAVLRGAGARDNAVFAPPHHLRVALQSSQSGRNDVYVADTEEAAAGPWRAVSTGGGTQPLWARSGRDLFFLAPDGAVMVAADGAAPLKLFAAPVSLVIRRSYAVTADGQRILMPVLDDRVKHSITVLPPR